MQTYVTLTEAATYLGISKATLRNWDKEGKLKAIRHPLNKYRVYDLEDLRKLKPQQTLPDIEAPITTVKREILDLRGAKRFITQIHNIIRDTDGHSSIVERFDEFTKLLFLKLMAERYSRLQNLFERNTSDDVNSYANRVRKTYADLSKTNRNIIPNKFAELKCSDETIWDCGQMLAVVNFSGATFDIKGLAYEEVIKRTFDKGDNQQFFTPPQIVSFMVAFAKPFLKGTIGDPAAGTGGFLVEVVKTGVAYSKLVGLEIDERLSWVIGMNLLLHGAERFETVHLTNGGTLGDKGRPFFNSLDAILTNPPFGSDYSDVNILQTYILGRGRTSRRRGILFLERCHALLRKGGFLAIILDEGVLNSSSAQDVRKFILDHFEIRAIISLPETAFMPYANVNASILFLQKAVAPKPATLSFFAKAETVGRKANGDEDIIYDEMGTARLNSDLPEILRLWEKTLAGRRVPISELAYTADVRKNLEGDESLRLDFRYHHPSRHLSQQLLDRSKNPLYHLADLCEERNISVVPSTELQDQVILYTGLANIESKNGVAHQIPTPANSLKSAVKRYEPGDILFARMRPNLRKVAWMNFSEGGYVSPECSVLIVRNGPDGSPIIDPLLLSILLRSDLVFGQIMHLIAGIGRPRLSVTDLRKVSIPLPSKEAQKQVRELFEEALTASRQLRGKATTLTEQADELEKTAISRLAASIVEK
jgi:excisionase family DNA binding protein